MVHQLNVKCLASDDLDGEVGDEVPLGVDRVLDHWTLDGLGADLQDGVRIRLAHAQHPDVLLHQLLGPDQVDPEDPGGVRTLELLVGDAVSQREGELVGKNLHNRIIRISKRIMKVKTNFIKLNNDLCSGILNGE